jgi:hypothetical protein
MPIKIKSTSGSVTLDAQNVSGDQTITVPSLAGGKTLLTTDGDGSSLTGVGVDGIVSSANATAITITSAEHVGVGITSPGITAGGSRYLTTGSQSANAAGFFELVGNRTANASQDVAIIKFVNNTTQIAEIGAYDNGSTNGGDLKFFTSSGGTTNERLRIDSAGNMGLGVEPESSTNTTDLYVGGRTAVVNWGNGSYFPHNAYENSSSWKYRDTAAAAMYSRNNNGDHIFEVASSGSADAAISFTTAMTINNNGSVNISNNSNIDAPVVDANGTGESWGGNNAVYRASADRSASSSYRFFVSVSNENGSHDVEQYLRGDGQAYADGSWNGGGADYAEYFEWSDGNPDDEDRRGISVVLESEKIRPAVDGEDPIGVISGRPAVVGDTDIGRWKQKHLRDDFGTYVLEPYTVTEWEAEEVDEPETEDTPATYKTVQHDYESDKIPEGITVPDDAVVSSEDGEGTPFERRKLNPEWNESLDYISREDRPEWDAVGLMGKIRIRVGQPTGSRWIKMRDVSVNAQEWLVR